MTDIQREIWLRGATHTSVLLGTGGECVPRFIDNPKAPRIMVQAGELDRDLHWTDVVAPGVTTRHPCLYLMKWQPEPYDPEDVVSPAIELRFHDKTLPRAMLSNTHWPPPIACKSANEGMNAENHFSDFFIKKGRMYNPRTQEYYCHTRKFDFKYKSCLRIANPAVTKEMVTSPAEYPNLVNCFYVTIVQVMDIMRYEESMASLRRLDKIHKDEDKRYAKNPMAFGPGLSNRVHENVYWKDPSSPFKNVETSSLCKEAARREAALDAKIAWMESSGKNKKRASKLQLDLMQWQRKRSETTITAKRHAVHGMPMRTLMDMGLVPKTPTKLVDALISFLGVGPLLGEKTLRKQKKNHTDAPIKNPMTREDLITLMFPPHHPKKWDIHVHALATISGGLGFPFSLYQKERLYKELTKANIAPEKIKRLLGERELRVSPRFSMELMLTLADIEIANVLPEKPHRGGWKHRNVPIFLLPIVLKAVAPEDKDNNRRWNECAWYQCANILASTYLLGEKRRIDSYIFMPSVEKEASVIDVDLMEAVMQQVWPQYPTNRASNILSSRYSREMSEFIRISELEKEFQNVVGKVLEKNPRMSVAEAKKAKETQKIREQHRKSLELLAESTATPPDTYMLKELLKPPPPPNQKEEDDQGPDLGAFGVY